MLEIVLRRNIESGEPEIFYIDPSTSELTCYGHIGQHSFPDRGYFLESCRPCNPRDADCRRLIDEWDNLGHRVAFRVMRRLKWWNAK